ncbi:TniQ family protein [Streptomyces sp. NPDC101455]|uniref:TniQ family protein n=1 Tax=Streptomyces sp. NPDC101455 TaxID=3366142 RepID=UPI0037F272B1
MSTGRRSLPIRCAPDPGEALDSWLEFIAARLTCPFTDVLGALGLPNRETAMSALVLPAWTIRLTRDELASITEVTGVAAGVLAAMTLQPFDGHAVDILPRHRRVNRRVLWGRAGSRFCPLCLADSGGRWLVAWRLSWSFACTRSPCPAGRPLPGLPPRPPPALPPPAGNAPSGTMLQRRPRRRTTATSLPPPPHRHPGHRDPGRRGSGRRPTLHRHRPHSAGLSGALAALRAWRRAAEGGTARYEDSGSTRPQPRNPRRPGPARTARCPGPLGALPRRPAARRLPTLTGRPPR